MTPHPPIFLYGTLCDLELLEIVAGERLSPEPAALRDHKVYVAKGQSFPVIEGSVGDVTAGLIVRPSTAAMLRLDFYEVGFGYDLATCVVEVAGQDVDAKFYSPEPGRWDHGPPWSLTTWQSEFATLIRETACDYINLCGRKSPQEAAALFPQVRARAASRLRARNSPSPVAFEPTPTRDAVQIRTSHRPFVDFFDVLEERLQFQTFAGGLSAEVQRISLLGGDAVTVLPYDPATDEVLVIRQFRHGAYSRGDLNPWCIEPPAGRLDPLETSEEAALRELKEETGLSARKLHQIASYYPSPAAFSEHLTSFVATADLSAHDRTLGGLAAEHEDIMSHVIPFTTLMEMIQSGAANTGPLVLSALWLQGERHSLT